MFTDYSAHIRGEPERKIWSHTTGFLIATKPEMEAALESTPLLRIDRPRTSLTREEANQVARDNPNAVVIASPSELTRFLCPWKRSAPDA
jgi:hypothetical protein